MIYSVRLNEPEEEFLKMLETDYRIGKSDAIRIHLREGIKYYNATGKVWGIKQNGIDSLLKQNDNGNKGN